MHRSASLKLLYRQFFVQAVRTHINTPYIILSAHYSRTPARTGKVLLHLSNTNTTVMFYSNQTLPLASM